MKCLGRNLDDHCCYINGKVCQFLEEGTEVGYKFSCGLRRELGSWDAVVKDARYVKHIAPVFEPDGVSCADWPNADKGQTCKQCGANLPTNWRELEDLEEEELRKLEEAKRGG